MIKKRRRRTKGGPDAIDAHVGSRIRARRIGLQMSQARLGQALGVTFQQVQKYENGSNRVGASTLFRVATALGMSLDYFFEDLPAAAAKLKSKLKSKSKSRGLSDKTSAYSADPMASREAIQLVNNYFRIVDGDVRKQFFQFVKSVSRKKTGK